MALLRSMKTGGQWHRYCHAGYEGDKLVSGHPVPVHDPDDEQAMLDAGWQTDGRHWFCPNHPRSQERTTTSGKKWRKAFTKMIGDN